MYDAEKVIKLLPGVWDQQRILDAVNEYQPDRDMPKASGNPHNVCNKWVELSDIQRAWFGTVIDDDERCALLLIYGMDATYALAGYYLECSPWVVSERCSRGVEKLVKYLNGGSSEG